MTRFPTSSRRLVAIALASILLSLFALGAQADEYEKRRTGEAALELKVKSALLTEIGWDMMGVDVEAYGDRVVLMGEVENKAHEELAKEVAASVEGVSRVTNLLKVEKGGEATMKTDPDTDAPVAKKVGTTVGNAVGHAEREVNDAVLETRIKTKLIEELGFGAFDIEVEAVDGEVSLRGEVKDKARRKIAMNLAKDTKDVKKVIDLLRIDD